MVLEGIYTGIPRRQHKPIADGIVGGCKKDMNPKLVPELHKVAPSATQFSAGVYGAGATPQGDGDGKGSHKGMKMAHHNPAAGVRGRKAKKLEEHIQMHNM
jgi:hypothetical protein